MPFMPEDLKNKESNKPMKESIEKPVEAIPPIAKKEIKKVDTIANAGGADKESQNDSISAQEVLARKSKSDDTLIKPLISWDAPEYTHYEKGTLWYLAVIAITIIAITIAMFFRQWILIAVIVMFVIVLMQYSRREPRIKHYTIFANGVKIDDKMYLFKQLKSFSFIESSDGTRLTLQPLKRLAFHINLQLGNLAIGDIKAILVKHLPEQKKSEELLDRMSKKLKF
jgi:hypothetical protein